MKLSSSSDFRLLAELIAVYPDIEFSSASAAMGSTPVHFKYRFYPGMPMSLYKLLLDVYGKMLGRMRFEEAAEPRTYDESVVMAHKVLLPEGFHGKSLQELAKESRGSW